EIDILIRTSVCRDYIEPATATIVHGNLGLNAECKCFDLGNACLAFMNGMEIASLMIETGQIEHALIVNGEAIRDMYEKTLSRLEKDDCDEEMYRNSFATLTLGSGAVAMVLSHKDLARTESHQFLGGVTLADTSNNRLCCWKG